MNPALPLDYSSIVRRKGWVNPAELKNIFSSNNLRPLKKLGQNFLVDQNIQKKIIQNCQIKPDDVVLEIGSGLGALTDDLAGLAKEVVAVEKDRGLVKILKERLAGFKNVKILEEDILKIKVRKVFKNLEGKKIKIVGNLPYYITSPIIFFLLEQRQNIDSIFLTVQKEVGIRILARPGSKDYGRLSCAVGYFTQPKLLFNISKSAFYPRPKVDSIFMQLSVKENPTPPVKDETLFFDLIKLGFNQRRKTILNSLSDKKNIAVNKKQMAGILLKAGIDPTCRPETLSLEEFARLSDIVSPIL